MMKSFKLSEFNALSLQAAREALTYCCGSSAWVDKMASSRPFKDRSELLGKATNVWNSLSEEDWKEAFTHHPKIGDLESLKKKFSATRNWAEQEQKGSQGASEAVLRALARGNETYENRFGYIFIVCATGKTAEEMLNLLEERLKNNPEVEIKKAALEQDKITHIRLEKLIYE